MLPQPTFLQKYRLTLILGAIVLVFGAALVCMLAKRDRVPEQNQAAEYAQTSEAIEAVSASIITEESISSNPVENKLPELNPVEKTNPYASYKNPFE